MLRHTEKRYEIPAPNETSAAFERVAALRDESSGPMVVPEKRREPREGLVLVAAVDCIGGARRALEILGIVPRFM